MRSGMKDGSLYCKSNYWQTKVASTIPSTVPATTTRTSTSIPITLTVPPISTIHVNNLTGNPTISYTQAPLSPQSLHPTIPPPNSTPNITRDLKNHRTNHKVRTIVIIVCAVAFLILTVVTASILLSSIVDNPNRLPVKRVQTMSSCWPTNKARVFTQPQLDAF